MHTFQDQNLKDNYPNEQAAAQDFQTKYALINEAGEEVLPFLYDKITYEHTLKIYLIEQGNLSGFANQKGEVVLSCLFDLDYVLAFLQK